MRDDFHSELQTAFDLHRQGRLGEAAAIYRRLIARNPGHLEALHYLGLVHAAMGELTEARNLIERSLSGPSPSLPFLENYATILCRIGDHAAALEASNKGLQKDRAHAGLLYLSAVSLYKLRRLDEALARFDAVLAIEPNYVAALNERGSVLAELKRHDEALAVVERALALDPRSAEACLNRGNICLELKRYAEAAAAFDKALQFDPNLASAWLGRGNLARELKHLDEAVIAHDKALALNPDLDGAWLGRGNALKDLGRLDEAIVAYERSVALNPMSGVAYFGMADVKKFIRGDPQLAVMESLAARVEHVSIDDRMHLDFALAKAYDDIHDYARSFQHLSAANAAKRVTLGYDEQADSEFFDAITRIFSPELMTAKAGSGDSSERPIFVLGMPRSGTTLVEQILASHPDVYGAGEIAFLPETFLDGTDGSFRYPETIPMLDQAALAAMGASYVKRLSALAPNAKRITDKSPSNFLHIGFIHLVLPKAFIVHCQRDPVDTCLSCYSKLFDAGQNHTYDLGELGRYYARYLRLMRHWQRVLPPQRVFNVRYEDIVADLEGQTRRLLAYCGLAFDERCLAFHETKRPVYTASNAQVRRPLYNSAVARWRDYERFLGPLLTELGIAATKEPEPRANAAPAPS